MRSKFMCSGLAFLLIACCFIPSAMASVSWYKDFGNQSPGPGFMEFLDIAPTNDGGSIALAMIIKGYPYTFVAYKLDKFGKLQWQKDLIAGVSFKKVIQASDGGYVFLAKGGSYTTYLFKVSEDGNGEWYTILNGEYSGGSIGTFPIIIQSHDGGFLLVNGSELVKIDSRGKFVQKTHYKRPDGSTFPAQNFWNAAAKTPEGDLIVGFFASKDSYNIYVGKLLIFKLKQDGTIIWQKEVDYSNFSPFSADVHAISYTPDGGFVVGLSFLGYVDNALLKFDSAGQLQFQKKIRIGYNPDALLRDIIVTSDNGYLIAFQTRRLLSTNSYESPIYKFNNSGEYQWAKLTWGSSRRIWKKMPDDTLLSAEDRTFPTPSVVLTKTSNLLDLSGCDPIYGSIPDPAPEIWDFNFQVRDTAFTYSTYSLSPGSTAPYVTSDYTQPAPVDSCFKKPIISLSSASIDFGAAKLNQTVTKNLVITNSGDAYLNISQVHQPDSPKFTASGVCSLLAPKTSCTLTLTFTPTTLGTVSGLLSIDSDDPYKPTEFVALSGSSSDSTPPLTSYYLTATPGLNGWFTSDVAVSLEATDADSGVDSITYSINGLQVKYPGSAVSFNAAEEKANTITFSAVDNAGNQESATTIPVNIDKTAPTIAASVSTVPNNAGWYNTSPTVSFACSDAVSGIAECTPPVTLPRDGAGQIVSGKAVDKAGFSAESSVTVNLDTTPPTITINGVQNGGKYPLGLVPAASYSASDSLSGVAASSDTLTGGDGLGLGIFTYTVTVFDLAGNKTTANVSYEVISTPEGLIALIRQMLASGKIDNAGIANSLISKVENAQKANGQAADNIMQAFISQVEAQSGKHIASDAAAILIHAAEYIISN